MKQSKDRTLKAFKDLQSKEQDIFKAFTNKSNKIGKQLINIIRDYKCHEIK
jgi:hypothetical protein